MSALDSPLTFESVGTHKAAVMGVLTSGGQGGVVAQRRRRRQCGNDGDGGGDTATTADRPNRLEEAARRSTPAGGCISQ